jgi:hypothetical protein
MDTAARYFSTLAQEAAESVRPARDAGSEEVIEYRVSRKAIDRIKESLLQQSMRSQPVPPGARR